MPHRKNVRCFLLVFVLLADAGLAQHERPNRESGPTEVQVRLAVLNIDKVNDGEQEMVANVFFELKWRDPRLAHEGPRALQRPLTEIWYPDVAFVNRRSLTTTLPLVATITPDGEVTAVQRVWGAFSQRLDLQEFPFDRQDFVIQLASARYDSEGVRLVRDPRQKSIIAESMTLPNWTVNDTSLTTDPYQLDAVAEGRAGFAIQIEASRKAGYFLLKVILPLVFIVAMS